MTKRIFTYSMAAIAAMGLSLTSCSDEMESTVDIQSGALATRTIAAGEQYGLTTVDLLAGQHNDAGDVMIWRDNDGTVVYVGSGDIDRLWDHSKEYRIIKYSNKYSNLMANYAIIGGNDSDIWRGIERYLADKYQPLEGDRYPADVDPIEVNGPGE